MTVYWYEIKKLFSSMAVWGFISLCLMFNLFLVINSSGDPYANFIGAVSKDTGYLLNLSFYDNLTGIKTSEEQMKWLERLKSDTDNVTDVFDDYHTSEIGESYITASGATGSFAKIIREKYSLLQKVVDEKGKKNESLSLYFAGATYTRHQQLFHNLMGWILIEGILLSVLVVFLSLGYEQSQRTQAIVYSTKKGRRILVTKLSASISMGLGAYMLLALFTLLIYFIMNDYGDIWNSNVSSIFNYRHDLIAGDRPFVTWHSFRVVTYLGAMLGLSISLILCFSLMAFGIAVLIRNDYTGFLFFIAINATIVVLPMQLPQTLTAGLYVRYYSMLTPVWLWLKHSIWFTDGDVDILWPHFETLGISVSFSALLIICGLANTYFRKRDLT